MPKKIKVRSKPGQIMPVPSNTAVDGVSRVFTAENPVEVYKNAFVVRRIRSGDLVEEVEPAPPKPKRSKKAKAEGEE